jgi:L-asparaginase
VALDRRCAQAGALVVMNDQIFTPDQACKAHTTRTDAFIAREGAPIGVMADGLPHWRHDPGGLAHRRPSLATQFHDLPTHLPRVDILTQQVDVDVAIVDWMLSRGARGIVVAGTGHGSIADPLQSALHRAAAAGCIVVRASRVAAGAVHRGASVDDDAQGFVAAGFLPPHKARLLTALALAGGLGRDAIQALFAQY